MYFRFEHIGVYIAEESYENLLADMGLSHLIVTINHTTNTRTRTRTHTRAHTNTYVYVNMHCRNGLDPFTC
jgi:hypothetical protein